MGPCRGLLALMDSCMHGGPWLGVQDTIVGESDPALPLGRKTDFRAIKHTMKSSFSSS